MVASKNAGRKKSRKKLDDLTAEGVAGRVVANMNYWRKRRKLSVSDLARVTRILQPNLYTMLTHPRNMRLSTVHCIAKGLKVDPGVLFAKTHRCQFCKNVIPVNVMFCVDCK